MIRLFKSTFDQLLDPLTAPINFYRVRARLGLALRFSAAVVVGMAVVVGAIVVWAAAAIAIAIVGDVPPRRSFWNAGANASRLSGRSFCLCRSCMLALSHDDLIERTEERRVEFVESSMSDLHKKARELCYRDGLAWSLEDFRNRVSGVTMLTVVVNENKRQEYLNRAREMLKKHPSWRT
jgi:hypothetical protein